MFENFTSSISGIYDSASKATSDIMGRISTGSVADKALDVLDPSKSRLAIAGLFKGGTKGTKAQYGIAPTVKFTNETTDWRVKISLGAKADYFYKANDKGLLEPLEKTGGVIFPYTPQISVTHAARYGSQNLTHSNYTNYFYEGSEVQAITISGDFTVQNIQEGQYVMACIQFFRSVTKMFFGQGANVGHPPPMVFLSGYGTPYFPNVPCVVTNFQHTLPQDVDYINIYAGVNEVRLPTTSTMSVTLQPIYSRRNLADNFDLNEFAKGNLLNGKFI